MVPWSVFVLLVLVPSFGWAGRTFDVQGGSDPCMGVCEFRLCLAAAEPPHLQACTGSEVDSPDIVVRTSGPPPRGSLRLRLGGRRTPVAVLECSRLGLVCGGGCATDTDCRVASSSGRCVDGLCQATTLCGAGSSVPLNGVASFLDNFLALADTCSELCEFHLCIPTPTRGDTPWKFNACALDAIPPVLVRASREVARQRHLRVKLGRARAELYCVGPGAACFPCTHDDECFSGGRCDQGHCVTTALCR